MSVGEVGSVNVAIWMVSALHGGENISDAFGEASCQAVGVDIESIHLFEQIIVFLRQPITTCKHITEEV